MQNAHLVHNTVNSPAEFGRILGGTWNLDFDFKVFFIVDSGSTHIALEKSE